MTLMVIKVMTCFVIRYEISSEVLMYGMVTVENNNIYLKFANIVDAKCSHLVHTKKSNCEVRLC